MGNVNGREDGDGSPSGAEEEGVEGGDGVGSGLDEGMAAPSAALGVSPPDLMGQSPPHSPRATQSPLMFTPQVSSFSLCLFLFLISVGLFFFLKVLWILGRKIWIWYQLFPIAAFFLFYLLGSVNIGQVQSFWL